LKYSHTALRIKRTIW